MHANVTGSYTIGGCADLIRWVLSNKYLLPTAIVSLGICFGTQEKENKLGDVIIAKKVYPYFVGSKINNEELYVVDDNMFNMSYDLSNEIQSLIDNNQFSELIFNVDFENYMTGEAVISSEKARNKFNNITTQKIYAGDMEGYGLFRECNDNGCNIPCIIIKSICDWGIEKNFDEQNEEILKEFETVIAGSLSIKDDKKDEKEFLLKTLKNRIQAFSANCAFETFDVILNKQIFQCSVVETLKKWLKTYNGVATTCREFNLRINSIIDYYGIGLTKSPFYLHRCLMILEDEGLIQCDSECRLKSENDICIKKNNDAAVNISKGR